MAKYSRKRTKNVRSNRRSRRSRKVSRKNYSRKRRITKKNKRRVSKKRTLRGGKFLGLLSKKEKMNKAIKIIFESEKLFDKNTIINKDIEKYIENYNKINAMIDEKNLSVGDLNEDNVNYLTRLEAIISDKQTKLQEDNDRRQKLGLSETASDDECVAKEEANTRRQKLGLSDTASDADCVAKEEANTRRQNLGLPDTASDADCVAKEEEIKIKDDMKNSIKEYIEITDTGTALSLALSNAIRNPVGNPSANNLYNSILDNVNNENALTDDKFNISSFGNLPNIDNDDAEQQYKDGIKEIYKIYKSKSE
tara:strand:- start:5299 stop:6225 length:927 start_codon:yes stop_codon:yes gene_type:complete